MAKFKLLIKNHNVSDDQKAPEKLKKDGYDIRRAIKNVVLHRDQKHNGFRYYTISKVVNKIFNCKDDYIILDNQEYIILKEAFDRFAGFSSGDDELIRRIYEPEQIEE